MIEIVVLGLGSNTGNRMINLKRAIKAIYFLQGFDILTISNVYETEPWGFKNQKNFLNCILAGIYKENPVILLERIKDIEFRIGRLKREKWHSREIDIDILFFGKRVIMEKNLIIPHPQIQFRNFILVPCIDILPDFFHPVLRKKIISIYKTSKDKGKVRLYRKIRSSDGRTVKYYKSQ